MIDLTILNKNMETLGLTLMEDIGDRNIGTYDKMKFKDNEGYLYSLSQGNMTTTIRRNGILAKYFQYNPYTHENINNYFKLNKINLELITKNPKTAISKLEFRCTEHDEIFLRSWNSVKNGSTLCSNCENGRRTYTYKQIKQMVETEGCELLDSEYKGFNEVYSIRCSCGEQFYRRLDTLLVGHSNKCHKCSGIKDYDSEGIRKTLLEHDIELLSEYKGSANNITVKYSCGFITDRCFDSIASSNYKCPHCNKKGYKRNTERFYEEVYGLVDSEYTFYGEYVNCDTKMKVKHNACDHEYYVTPTRFINGGRRCPYCNRSSKPELYIEALLQEKGINFTEQYEYDDLLGTKGGRLRFDFAIFDTDNNLVFQLEYDGEYHYLPILGQAKLEYQQEHDRRKDEYCKLHNIDLLRIPYWDFDNIETILNDKLKEKELIA